MDINAAVTRGYARVVSKAHDMEDRDKTDPVVVYTMALLEKEAVEFGQGQLARLNNKSATATEVRFTINVWVARQDAEYNLSAQQMAQLSAWCYRAARLRP
jgi:hypothetical protein